MKPKSTAPSKTCAARCGRSTIKLRVAIGGLFHESHSFIAGATRWNNGDVVRGDALLAARGDASPLGGALEAATEFGWEIIPTLDWRAMPSSLVEDEVVELWWREFENCIRDAGKLDAIFLVLHGAMASVSCADVEGEILRRARELVGESVFIAGVTDLHANFSPAMAAHADALITYRENPHTDAAQSARRAVALLNSLLVSPKKARTVFLAPPLVLPPTATATADEPMRTLEQMAREIEATNPDIFAVNVHAGYAFADTPDTGVSFSAITTGDEPTARAALNQLARYAWDNKHFAQSKEPTLDEIWPEVETALQNGSGPILLVEPSDNIGGGAWGDSTHILRALFHRKMRNCGVVLCDSGAVQKLQNVAMGETVRIAVGGWSGALSGGALEISAQLVRLHPGAFELEDAHSHLAAMSGLHIEMGPCALIETEGIFVLLTTRATPPFDLGQWRAVGIDPENLAIIGIKAAVAHRRAYDPIARASFTVSTPGPCASDLSHLPFARIRRPIFPLESTVEFDRTPFPFLPG